ncbi:MAG TPA: GNAT family N-acetyltransferase [Thermoanaerobaculia bacterium]|nr:GNAT family N-acetyltransferase [Thermoanaerobaculia bacterium]
MHAEAEPRFLTRRYQRGDETAILDLFNRSFHEPRSLEHWRWKYEDDPYGGERISVTFDAAGALVGHYAGYPVQYFRDGAGVLAHQIGDTMTEPSVRHIGRGPTGVLGRTALHFYETFCDGQVAFNYGFNVANIQKFSMRFLRSDRVENVAYRYRDLRANPLPQLSRIERYARGVRFELAAATSPEWDELFTRVASRYGFLARRDARYVSWRYFARPDVRYVVVAIRKWWRLVGWVVFRIRNDRMTIGDLLLDPDHAEVLELVLRHLTAVYPAAAIEGWFPPRPRWIEEILAAAGLEQRQEPQDLSVMCVPFVDPDASDRIRQSLYYSMGDSDLF